MNDDLYIGTTFDNRFYIEDKIGAGGYGAVYQATELETGERIALKLLHPVIATDHQIVARFRRECMVLIRLKSPHIVLVHEFSYTDDGLLYLVMELLQGRSLKQLIRKEAPIRWPRALELLVQLCDALSAAHAAGVVHRDLKPENIFLVQTPDNPEFVKVLDFGIAKFLDGAGLGQDNVTQLTAQGRTVGTIRYMSPEQILGRPVDSRSDIYTLGVVMYRLLTARMPFPGARKPGALIAAQMQNPPRPPSRLRPDMNIDDGVDRLVLRMLNRNPGDRFADMNEVRATCETILAAEEWDESQVIRTLPSMPKWLATQQQNAREIADTLPNLDTVDAIERTESLPSMTQQRDEKRSTDDTVEELAFQDDRYGDTSS